MRMRERRRAKTTKADNAESRKGRFGARPPSPSVTQPPHLHFQVNGQIELALHRPAPPPSPPPPRQHTHTHSHHPVRRVYAGGTSPCRGRRRGPPAPALAAREPADSSDPLCLSRRSTHVPCTSVRYTAVPSA